MATAISVDDALAWLGDDQPCLAFAGAGISIPAPTCAPSVAVALRATTALLTMVAGLPSLDASSSMQAIRSRLLPESCYGSIAAAAGSADHLRLWSSYAWAATPEAPGPHPNAGHSLLAWLAHRHGLPVVTTNFDCFFEEAVTRQGLRPVVGLPDRRNHFAGPVAAADEVAIWKLHGSALDIATIRSQAADLARSSYRALGRSFPIRPRKLLVVGYSGRDFDVFPWLARIAATADCLWVDIGFNADHRARTLPDCWTVTGSFEDLARAFWFGARTDRERTRWRRMVDEAITRPAGESGKVRAQYAERVRAATVDQLTPVLAGDRQRASLALATAIATVADFPTAQTVLTAYSADPDMSVRTQLLRFFVLESMDLHRDAEVCAKAAWRQALSTRDVFGLGRSEIALVYARIRRFIGTIRDPDIPRAPVRFDKPVLTSARLIADVMLLAPVFGRAAFVVRRRAEERRHYDALDFASDYIEHLIRFGAFIAIVIERLGSIGRTPLRLMWLAFGSAASAVGYMRGVLNIRKYSARFRKPDSAEDSAVYAASLIGDAMAGAVASRDTALELLDRMHNATGADRDALREAAQRELLQSLVLATTAGNPSMKVKVLLVMRRHSMPLPLGESEIRALVRGMQGEADENIADAIIARLTS